MDIKCSVFIAASLDGFIARSDGDIDWLHSPRYALPEQTDFGYASFMSTVDTLVMGRHTFEKVLTFGQWPYPNTPVVVLTSHALDLPETLHGSVTVANGSPASIVSKLHTEGKRHLYIDGGATIQRFLQAKLIHELTLSHIPILLGSGIPLFSELLADVHLRLITSQYWDNGIVQSTYATEYDSVAG